jgi:hypothetical protein
MQSTTPVQHNAAYTLSPATLKETTGNWGIRIYNEYMPARIEYIWKDPIRDQVYL